jgi:hypothetical protein
MPVFDTKSGLYREISAMKTLSDGYPSLIKNKAFDEVTDKKSSLLSKAGEKKAGVIAKSKDKTTGAMSFVKNVLLIISGLNAIQSLVVATLSRELPKIEDFIKKALKDQLKEMVNCGSDPQLPDYLKQGGAGINVNLNNVDFFKLFNLDPTADNGKLLYSDAQAGLSSTDMHTFLYDVIQDDALVGGTSHDWGAQTMSDPIMSITYSSQTPTAARVLNIKASQYYSDNKSLTDFNNDYIDSLTILPTAQVFNQLIDAIFGSVSVDLEIPKDWLKKQEEVNKIIERMISAEEEIVIDDSFFEFTGQDLWDIEEAARQRSKGIRYFITCDNVATSVSIDTLLSSTTQMETASTKQELEDIVKLTINTISTEVSKDVAEKDKPKFSFEFFDSIFESISMTVCNSILSPKLATLLQVNNKIVYGDQAEEFNNPTDYIFKNRTLYDAVIKAIKSMLLAILMAYALKKLNELISNTKAKNNAEQTKLAKAQILSLIGMPAALTKLMNMISSFSSTADDKINKI